MQVGYRPQGSFLIYIYIYIYIHLYPPPCLRHELECLVSLPSPCISILNSIPLARALGKGYHWNWISSDLRDHTHPSPAFVGLCPDEQKTTQKSDPHLQPQFRALAPQCDPLYHMCATFASEPTPEMEPKVDTNRMTLKM